MSTTIGEFAISLFVDAGKGELTLGNLVSSMGSLEAASVGEIAVLYELGKVLSTLTDRAINLSVGLTNYATATGASTEKLQQWQHVAEHAGISAQTMESALRSISSNLAKGAFSGDYGNLKNLGLLLERSNLTLKDFKAEHPEELLEKIRASSFFQSLPNATQDMLLASAGLNSVLGALQKSRISDEEFARYMKEGGFIREEDRKKLNEVHEEFVSIYQIVNRIGNIISTWFSGDAFSTLKDLRKVLSGLADISEKPAVKTVAQSGFRTARRIASDIVLGNSLDLLSVYRNAFSNIKSNIPTSGAVLVDPVLYEGAAHGGSRHSTFHMVNNLKIEGNPKMSHAETFDAIRMAFDGVFQPVAAQASLGPL